MRRPSKWMSATTIALAIVVAGAFARGAGPSVEAQVTNTACLDNSGITVVIDFRELGGGVNIRCAPQPVTSGIDAFGRAGIAMRQVLSQPGFVCQIAGVPSDQQCVVTPPSEAYWSYWVAPRGGTWCYSNVGASTRIPPPGTAEGWSFSLDRASSEIPPPGILPPPPIPGQAPAQLNQADCTTPTNPGVTTTTTAPTSTSSTTTTSSSTTSTTTSTIVRSPTGGGGGSGSSTGGGPGSPSATTRPALDPNIPIQTGVDPPATSIVLDSPLVSSDSTLGGRMSGAENSAVENSDDRSDVGASGALVDQRTGPHVPDSGSPLGTVDLSDDGRDGGGSRPSTILAILGVAAVAAAGVVAARRRRRDLRVET